MSAPPLDRSRPPEPGPVRAFRFPAVQHARLDSGLAVLGARHGAVPVVTAQLAVRSGAAADPDGRAGLAHLTARALEAGTADRSADRLARDLERLGTEFEAQAHWDATLLRLTLPAHRLEPALALFAEIARRPAFPEDEVGRLRDEQLAEILQRGKEPRALANDMAARCIFAPDIRYGSPLVGTAASVGALDRDAVAGFFQARYAPADAALLLVGAIDPEAAADLARAHFGDWTAPPPAPAAPAAAPRVPETTVFLVDRPGAVQSEIRIGHLGLERHHPDYFPALVMNGILGGTFTSRLNLSLREKHGFTYGVRSTFSFRRQPGPFIIQVAVANDVTARAIEEVLREVHRLRDDGATADEVAAARDFLVGVMPLELQTTEQLAGRLADLFVYDLPDDWFEQHRRRIAAVTADDVHRAARDHVHPDRFAIVVVGDADAIEADVRALGLGPVERLPADPA